MSQMSVIFVSVFVAVISLSEAAQFGFFPSQMAFQQRMPSFGMPPFQLMNQMMLPMMPPKMNDLILQQIKMQAMHQKILMEQQRLMQEALAAHMAALAPKPAAVETVIDSSKESKSISSKSSERSKVSSSLSSSSNEKKLPLIPTLGQMPITPGQMPITPGQMPLTPGQMPITPGLPGSNFQSVSYSTSSSSSNVNGVPSASQTGQITVNDNGKLTSHVF